MVAERHPRSGSKKNSSKQPGDGKQHYKASAPNADAKRRKVENAASVAITRARITCASEYWAWEVTHHGAAVYAPNQRCRCPACIAASPERKVKTPAGLSLMQSGRLWPRQSADVIRIHYECRQIELAPKPLGEAKWTRRARRQSEDAAWISAERGCWRACVLTCNDVEPLRKVQTRLGTHRDIVGMDLTGVVALEDRNVYLAVHEQVDDPAVLAEVNSICEEGENSGLLDLHPEADHAALKFEIRRNAYRGL